MRVEIAVQDARGAGIAYDAGAVRAELCVALQLGGLTPSAGLIRQVRSTVPELPVHILVRPRPGGFAYSPAELDVMAADISDADEAGAAGVVLGALTAAGKVDSAVLQTLLQAGPGLEYTFHRAIDQTESPVAALEVIAGLGFCRVLTSGGSPTAVAGLPVLQAMAATTHDLTILAGGGVVPDDFPHLAAAGIREVHLSAKAVHRPTGTGVPLSADDDGGNSYQVTDPVRVAAAIERAARLP